MLNLFQERGNILKALAQKKQRESLIFKKPRQIYSVTKCFTNYTRLNKTTFRKDTG